MQRLARHADVDDQALLLAGLKDKNHYVAALAAEALGGVADLSAARVMIDTFIEMSTDGLKRDPGCHIRAALAYGFGRLEILHADEALGIGIRTVQIEPVGGVRFDTGAHLRANCALALAQIRSQNALRDITLLLFNHGGRFCGSGDALMRFVEARKAAARALARLGASEARVPLTLRLAYPEGEAIEVLQECMLALVELDDPDLKETLLPFLDGEDAELAVYAGLMLGQARVAGAEGALRSLIDRLSGSAMRAAVLALAALRTEEAADQLRQLALSDRKVVREAVQDAGIG